MKEKVLMAVFCIFLIVFSSVQVSAYSLNEEDDRDLGEVVLINVDKYEPATVSADYLRNKKFPVYVHLTGTTLESFLWGGSNPEELDTLFGGLKIDRIHIVRDSISRYVAGITERPPKEDGYFVDANGEVDLGYLKIDLRRIPKEEDLPDRIDLNFTARVYFDTESSFSVFGKQDLFLELGSGINNLEIAGDEDSNKKSRVKVWDGRAELEFLQLRGDRATFQLYDGSGRKLGGPFTLRTGQIQTLRLNDGPAFLDNQVRFKLKGIYGAGERAVINMYRHGSSNDVELVEDMNLYAGSDWVLEEIGRDKVQLRNLKTRQTMILNVGQGDFDTDICERIDPIQIDSDELFLRGVGFLEGDHFEDDTLLGRSSSFYCSAIDQYERALTYAIGEEASEIKYSIGTLYEKVGDMYNALEMYDTILPETDFYRTKNVQKKIDDLNFLIANEITNSKILEDDVRVYLKEVIDVEEEESYFMFRTITNGIKGQEFTRTIGMESQDLIVESVDGGKTYEWYARDIDADEITVIKVDEDGRTIGSPRKLDIGEHILDNTVVEITDITTPYSVIMTAIPGDGRSYGVSNFQVHIPIEKSMIQWTPEQIDNMIDKSHKAVEDIEKIMDKLGNFIKGMKVACFGIYGVLAIKNAFFRDNNVRKEVVDEKSRWCNDGIRTGELDYKKLDECLEAESSKIEQEITERKGLKNTNDNFFKNNKLMKQDASGINVADPSSASALANKLKTDSGINIKGEDIENLLNYDSYTGFTTAEAQRLSYLASHDPEAFEVEWRDYQESSLKAKTLHTSLGGVTDPVQIQTLATPIFTPGKTTTDFSSGPSGIETQVKAIDPSAQIFEARSIQSDGGEFYVSSKTGTEAVKVEIHRDANLNPVEFGDYYLYKGSGNRYFLHKGDVTQLYRQNYNSNSHKVLQINDDGKLWMFPFSSSLGKRDDPLYDKVDYANYVVVDYDDSGKIKSYNLMNVGADGEINYPGTGDDVPVPRAPYLLWPPAENRNAQYVALANQVDSEYKKFATRSLIPGKTVSFGGDLVYSVSESASRSLQQPTTQCEYYMSASDCKLLYNFCDPVMCPASRFDLGNRWNVDNVVQTGIIGSLVLGMPNSIALGGNNIVPPICLTGVHAGLDNLRSKFQGFEDCLQKAKVEGEDVGICNTIRSVYMCEIMWREGLSIFGSLGKLADVVSEKVFGIFGGDGWEYSRWQESWGELRDNVNFFTTEYSRSAFVSYQSRSLGEFGSEICKAAIYGKTPGAGDFIGELLEPDSPYQFTGWFDELEYSSVEEGRSIYRVYYHIYAGRDEDIEYVAYLKGPGLNNLYVTNPERGLRREYLRTGEYADRSYTITGDTGYNTMCIFINGNEQCGFGKVSSSYASQQLQDWMLEDELLRNDIETAEECMPDTPHLNPYLPGVVTPSLPGAGAISEQGVIRICSADDPDGTGTRWLQVGTCGENELGISLGNCYIDYENSANFNDLKKKDEVADEYINETVKKEIDEHIEEFNLELDKVDVKVNKIIEQVKDKGVKVKEIDELMTYPALYLDAKDQLDDSSVHIRTHKKVAEIFNALGNTQLKIAGVGPLPITATPLIRSLAELNLQFNIKAIGMFSTRNDINLNWMMSTLPSGVTLSPSNNEEEGFVGRWSNNVGTYNNRIATDENTFKDFDKGLEDIYHDFLNSYAVGTSDDGGYLHELNVRKRHFDNTIDRHSLTPMQLSQVRNYEEFRDLILTGEFEGSYDYDYTVGLLDKDKEIEIIFAIPTFDWDQKYKWDGSEWDDMKIGVFGDSNVGLDFLPGLVEIKDQLNKYHGRTERVVISVSDGISMIALTKEEFNALVFTIEGDPDAVGDSGVVNSALQDQVSPMVVNQVENAEVMIDLFLERAGNDADNLEELERLTVLAEQSEFVARENAYAGLISDDDSDEIVDSLRDISNKMDEAILIVEDVALKNRMEQVQENIMILENNPVLFVPQEGDLPGTESCLLPSTPERNPYTNTQSNINSFLEIYGSTLDNIEEERSQDIPGDDCFGYTEDAAVDSLVSSGVAQLDNIVELSDSEEDSLLYTEVELFLGQNAAMLRMLGCEEDAGLVGAVIDSAVTRTGVEVDSCSVSEETVEEADCSSFNDNLAQCGNENFCFVKENDRDWWDFFGEDYICVDCSEIESCEDIQNEGKCDGMCGNVNGCKWDYGLCVEQTIEEEECLLTKINPSNFVGDDLVVDKGFVEKINRINDYATNNNVKVFITDSFRATNDVSGAIVTPSERSNHLVGHAIDMNLMYGANYGDYCNSGCLSQDTLPQDIQVFIEDIRSDSGLRWGGDFSTPDVVHIDDGLNLRSPDQWEALLRKIQENPDCY